MRIPSAARRSPPMPKLWSEGSKAFSSRRTSEAWRSPDASPAMMASFIGVRRWPLAVGRHLRLTAASEASVRPTANGASSQREVVHPPRQGDAANEEADEDLHEEDDAVASAAFPQ